MDTLPKRPAVEGPAVARAAKSPLNASTAATRTASTEPKSPVSQKPLCPCRAPPNLPPHVPAPSPGMIPDYLSLWPIDWFKCDWVDRRLATPELTKWPYAGRVSEDGEKSQFTLDFLPPASVAYLTTAAHDAAARRRRRAARPFKSGIVGVLSENYIRT